MIQELDMIANLMIKHLKNVSFNIDSFYGLAISFNQPFIGSYSDCKIS